MLLKMALFCGRVLNLRMLSVGKHLLWCLRVTVFIFATSMAKFPCKMIGEQTRRTAAMTA